MVKETTKDNKKYYSCEICGFTYEEKSTAEECQAYCKAHNSCSMEITKRAIQLKQE